MSVEAYKEKLREFIDANKNLKKQFKTMRQKIVLLTKENSELNEQLVAVAEQLSLCDRRTITDVEAKMRHIVEEDAELKKENSKLKQENSKLLENSNKLVIQNKQLSNQIQQLMGQLKGRPNREDIPESWEED